MARPRLHMVSFHVIWQPGQKIERGQTLARSGDIVFLALDNFDGDI